MTPIKLFIYYITLIIIFIFICARFNFFATKNEEDVSNSQNPLKNIKIHIFKAKN